MSTPTDRFTVLPTAAASDALDALGLSGYHALQCRRP